MVNELNPLQNFFNAKNVAIIGASTNPASPGYVCAENYKDYKKGKLFLINPKGGELFGHKLYKKLTDVEDAVNFALIITSAKYVPAATRDCAEKKVESVVIASGGFSEIGEEGKKLQEEIAQIINENDIRVIGPNCVGLFDPKREVDTIFLPPNKVRRPKPGPIAFFSQSGALGIAFLDEISESGDGRWVSRFISYGNAMDVEESAILDFLGNDEDTKVITGYIEGFRSKARDFLIRAEEISKEKPIILIKANRNPEGAKASGSHTASIATADDRMTSDLIRTKGIVRVYDWEEMLSMSMAFASLPEMKGNRIAVLTNGGGTAVMSSDAIGEENLKLAKFTDPTLKNLKSELPPFYIVSNPVDLTGSSTAEQFLFSLDQLMYDDNVDAILWIVLPSPPAVDVQELLEKLQERIMKENSQFFNKPIVTVSIGGQEAEILESKFEKLGLICFDTPESAVHCLKTLYSYYSFKRNNK